MSLFKSNITVFTKENFLIIEDYPIRQKINYNSIESVLIFHVGETYNNQMDFYLDSPILYENMNNKSTISKILFRIFNIFHSNKQKIEISLKDVYLAEIILELQNNLVDVSFPQTLENSLLWKTNINNLEFNSIKLIYNKDSKNLVEVLNIHNRIK